MNTALIFNIQKFCVHDGPGIRTTVFFKGCPLTCLWCHNPESQAFGRQILWSGEKCTGCRQCEQACPQQATGAGPAVRSCALCERCIDICIHNARELAGTEYTVSALMAEIEKDRPFYDQSGGGVTLSGGEALSQLDFAAELARSCRDRGIAVAVDTCGYAPFSSFEKILPAADLFLYDIKLMDAALHQKYTGRDNALILDNLQKLARCKARIQLRLPLIAGINEDDRNIQAIIDFVRDFRLEAVNLLPYHDTGTSKYAKLGRQYGDRPMAPPAAARLNEIKTMFEQANFKVKIGG